MAFFLMSCKSDNKNEMTESTPVLLLILSSGSSMQYFDAELIQLSKTNVHLSHQENMSVKCILLYPTFIL